MGPGALTYEGIMAWMQATGNQLRPWEVEAVKRVDRIWLKVQIEHQNEQRRKGG